MLQVLVFLPTPLERLANWLSERPAVLLLLEHGGRAVGILLAALIAARLAKAVLRRAARRLQAQRPSDSPARQRAETLLGLTEDAAKYVVWGAAVLLILEKYSPTVLGAAGIVGIAIGFGAQSLVRDVISGLFFVFEGQFAVGDFVEVNGVPGVVEEMGLRVVTLRDASGQRRFVSYGSISSVNNYTERRLTYRVNVPIAAEHEAAARDALAQALAQFQQEFTPFTAPAEEETLVVSEHRRLLRFLVSVSPFRRALVEQKLPAYLTTALKERNLPLPEGREISLLLEHPETAAA